MNFEGFLECMNECGMCQGFSFPRLVDFLERTKMNTRIFEVDVKDGEYYAKNIYLVCDEGKDTIIRCLKSQMKHLGGLCAHDVFPIFDALLAGKTAKVVKCQ